VDQNLKQLLLYQSYDQKIWELNRLAAQLLRESEDQQRHCLAVEAALERQRAETKLRQKELSLAELALRDLEEKLRELQRKRDRVTGGAQAAAVQNEAFGLDRAKTAAEEKYLSAMERCESSVRDSSRMEAELAELRRSTASNLENLRRRGEGLSSDRLDAEKMLAHLRDGIGKDWLSVYDSLRRSSLPPPYACRLDGLKCSGCHMHMAANAPVWGSGGAGLRRCEFCNRIIYDEPAEDGDGEE
jgi:predicted  nucleic acid-binding Zn-ribbon protein